MRHLSENQLNEYLDGELDGKNLREAGAHLENCPTCRAALERLQGVGAALASLAEEMPGQDLSRAVLRRLPEGRLSPGWKVVLAAQAGATLGVGLLLVRSAADWLRPQAWLEGAAGLLMGLEVPLADLSTRMPRLELDASPVRLALLGGSALVLWVVGNAILLAGRREVRK